MIALACYSQAICHFSSRIGKIIFVPLSFFHHLGLEYFIEIQHNTVKKMVPDYCCLLCDTNIKKGSKDKKSILEVARNHLKSSAHKMKFMVQVATSHCAFLC